MRDADTTGRLELTVFFKKKGFQLIRREEFSFIQRLTGTGWAIITGMLLNREYRRHFKLTKNDIMIDLMLHLLSLKSGYFMMVCSLKLQVRGELHLTL